MTRQFTTDSPTIDEILAKKKPRRQEVDVPLDSEACARLAELTDAIERAKAKANGSLATPGLADLEAELAELQATIGDAFVTFEFEQISRNRYRHLVEEHTVVESYVDDSGKTRQNRTLPDTFDFALIAECCVSHEMKPDQVATMFDTWGLPEWNAIHGAVTLVNNAALSSIPSGARSTDKGASSGPSSTTAAPKASRTRSS